MDSIDHQLAKAAEFPKAPPPADDGPYPGAAWREDAHLANAIGVSGPRRVQRGTDGVLRYAGPTAA